MDDHHDIESILCDGDTFCMVPTIAYTAPLEEIVGFAREYEKSGTPYAVTGLPLGDESPLLRSSEWLENIYRLRSKLFTSVCAVAYTNVSNTANNQSDAHSDEANAYTDRRS